MQSRRQGYPAVAGSSHVYCMGSRQILWVHSTHSPLTGPQEDDLERAGLLTQLHERQRAVDQPWQEGRVWDSGCSSSPRRGSGGHTGRLVGRDGSRGSLSPAYHPVHLHPQGQRLQLHGASTCFLRSSADGLIIHSFHVA